MTWNWTWYLALDCDGNAVSSSAETGTQSSLDWSWEWTWEWLCGAPPRPPPLDQIGAATKEDATSESRAAEAAQAPTATGPEGVAAGEPWLWSWTFTFCGETVSAVLPISTQTELQWQWDWIWSWACEAQASEPPSTTPDTPTPSLPVQAQEQSGDNDDGGSGAEPGAAATMPLGADGTQFPAWLIPLMPFTNLVPVLPMELPSLAGMFGSASIAVLVEVETPGPPGLDLVPGHTDTEHETTIDPPLVVSPLYAPTSPSAATRTWRRRAETAERSQRLARHSSRRLTPTPSGNRHTRKAALGLGPEASRAAIAAEPASAASGRHLRTFWRLRAERLRRRDRRTRRLSLSHRPRFRAADTGCAGAETARHVWIIDRSPWLRELSPIEIASVPLRGTDKRQLEGRIDETSLPRAVRGRPPPARVGVGTAAADTPSQDSGQLAASDQDALGAAGTAQQEPSNSNEPVRVLSPGDGGPVSQSNEASSNASAGNVNGTEQSADQTQSGDGLQAIGQSATSAQDAVALAFTVQQGASNENAPVSDLSPGSSGPVTQSNDASSDAEAGNLNGTEQSADQSQAGADSCRCGRGGDQIIGQAADNKQDAGALAATVQEKPSNENICVRVLSPGNDGPVTQSNEASSDASAANLNGTEQTAEQDQAGSGGSQVIGQAAENEQKAGALAATIQEKPSNKNVNVRVLSPGNNGPVTQSNTASSDATAANLNATKQTADQTQSGDSCKCGSAGSQEIGQFADNDQEAKAGALTVQHGASNKNVDVRVLSPGDGGPVNQSNTASSNATAANLNGTHQSADQSQTGGSCKCEFGLSDHRTVRR